MSSEQPPTPHAPGPQPSDPFGVEAVDEQIAAWLAPLDPHLPPNGDARLVRDLANLYQLPPTAEQALARAHERIFNPQSAPYDAAPAGRPAPTTTQPPRGAANRARPGRGARPSGLWAGVAAAIVVALLAGLFARIIALRSPASPPPSPTAIPTATAQPTATTAPTATTSPTAATGALIATHVGCDGGYFTQPQPMQPAGALSVTTPSLNLDYSSEMLPASASPNAPFDVTNQTQGGYNPNPDVNPSRGSLYIFVVCNQTGVAHTLTALNVTIANFTPSSDRVMAWNICNGFYNSSTKQEVGKGACGGTRIVDDYLTATFNTDQAGAQASASANQGSTNTPILLPPNHSIAVAVEVAGLTSQGTYELTFGVGADGAAPTTFTPDVGYFLIAPSAVNWTGENCLTPAMEAQIPASPQPSYYVCPPAS